MKKLLLMITTISFLAALPSCSESNRQSGSNSFANISQLMYKQENFHLPEDFERMTEVYYDNGIRLIYTANDGSIKIMTYDENMKEQSSIKLEDKADDISEIYSCIRTDGSIALIYQYVSFDDTVSVSSEDYYKNADVHFELHTFTSEGEPISTEVWEELGRQFTYGKTAITNIYAYGENYIVTYIDNIALVNSSGEILDMFENDEPYYFCTDSEGKTVAARRDDYAYMDGKSIKYDENKAVAYGKWITLNGGVFTGAGDYKLFFILNDGIYGMTYNDELVLLLDFLSSNISPSGIYYLAYAGEGKFFISGTDQTTTSGIFYSLLTVRPDDYVENKKTLTLGCYETSHNAPDISMNFNKKSDLYSVELKKYSDMDNLKSDILTGDAPDLICYNESAYMYRYSNIGAFSDMYEYMDKYDGIQREDIVDNVLEAMEYKGKLYGLPMAFMPEIYVANREVIGREYSNWNYEEFFSFAENLPEGMLLGSRNSAFAYRDIAFSYLCCSNYESWIDFDTNTCNFDSDEFVHLLDFCNSFELSEPFDEVYRSTVSEEQQKNDDIIDRRSLRNKTALLHDSNIYGPQSLILDTVDLGLYTDDNYTLLINPSDDRKGRITFTNDMCFSIIDTTSEPEGCWEFINFIMSKDYQDNYFQLSSHFHSNKESFNNQMNDLKEESEQYYFTESANGSFGYTISPDGKTNLYEDQEYTTHPITDENMEYFMDFINNSDKLRYANNDIYSILSEECAKLMNGETTSHQCADMIQNRVSLYLSEQS